MRILRALWSMPGMSDAIAFMFDAPHALSDAERLQLLGGKGKSLSDMTRTLGLPVPPGFTLGTGACRQYLRSGWSPAFDDAIDTHLARIEATLGRGFGDAAHPLLLSVRSGGAASMPGMMDTVLNVGLNADIVPGLAACSGGDTAFARDCLTRLHESFAKSVGHAPPHDPRIQLRAAIEAVFQSWNSARAQAYRRIEKIAGDAGTAVNIQAMVFGNRDAMSGTGVVFSRNPSDGNPARFGDILFQAQGEDVVSGSRQTMDIAEMADRLPEASALLDQSLDVIERHYRDLVDVEFTIESGKLWILQARPGKRSPEAAVRIAHDMALDPDFPLSRDEALARVRHLLAGVARSRRIAGEEVAIGAGLGASPGVASGKLVTSAERAVELAARGEAVILARPETSPEDIEGIAAAAGLLTSRGGLASHAAVVARGWGKPAVVGWAAMSFADGGILADGMWIADEAILSIDGETGEIFPGELASTTQIAPEAAAMAGWDDARADDGAAAAPPAFSGEELLLLVALKGFCPKDAAREIGGLDDAGLAAMLGELHDCLDAASPRFIKATDAGKRRGEQIVAAHGDAVGGSAARAILAAFHPLNDAFKTLVTAWQMRPSDGAPVFNDHSDPDYDAGILGQLPGLHCETTAWLAGIDPQGPLPFFRSRFETALARLRAGDTAYLASPKIDSYHNIWFELHEYLIRLAGMTRAEAEGG
ncbi:hypothetical protein EAO27_06040 [Sphingopyxis sp. YF1]|uniref:PEP/pyruvate-binding domain-containing protein n=1 Tax=Sphingopyxis sp. YF1 TaxID=2482763 RepID=UPI001F625D47|nr:PEP/pyruvate-binding domain-containing protein [Sphingopyxis sp. YF1]UNU42315.1 hypothetical protein EAO27_06040 [Sphingopyxis sp. YF1]